MSSTGRLFPPAALAEAPAGAEAVQTDSLWFVLHTRSRQEKALAADLQAMAIECYLPLTQSIRYYGQRKARVELPLFPGYLFLRGSVEQAYEADRTRRVAQLIPVVDQTRLEQELASLRLALTRGAALESHSGLEVGTWVEVRSGPFKGVRGIVEDRLQADRLWLQVQTLGQGASLEIDEALLEPIKPVERTASDPSARPGG